MTTELAAGPILHDVSEERLDEQERDVGDNTPPPHSLEDPSQSPPESSTDTGVTTPIDPLDTSRAPRLEDEDLPRPRLVKARTTGDYLDRKHEENRRRFLEERGIPWAARRFDIPDDYGLDELRAPPILPDRERRKSLEHAWSRRPPSLKRSFRTRLYDDVAVGSWITFLSIWGSLARIGLSSLSDYPGTPVFPLIWSQFVGCAIMGFLLQDKTLFPKEDRYVALYIGLTTGFCGSITSFSSFVWNCFQALANLDPYYPRSVGHNVIALAAQVIITLCVSIAALRFGAHVAQLTRHLLPSVRQLTEVRRYLDAIGITLAIGGWAASAIMTGLIGKWRSELFTTVLAPVGALLRWQLSRFNPMIPSFPLGTFAANISATVVLAVAVVIQGRIRGSLSAIDCAVIYGVANGFCGCLSTISTFAVELDTLTRRHAYLYATVSVFLGIILFVLIVGVEAWTVGFIPMCTI